MQMRHELTCTFKGPRTRYGESDSPESYTDLSERMISLAEVTSRSCAYQGALGRFGTPHQLPPTSSQHP